MTARKKQPNQSTPKKTRDRDRFDPLHQVAFWGLALLLFFPPYFRGLFFAPEQEKALIFATLVFWLTFLWRRLQKDNKFMRGPLDWFAPALPLIYIISSFTAVNKGLAIDEVVKNILYFMTYWSVSRLVRDEEDVHKLLHVIYISAIGVALAGLATATEIIHIHDGFNVTEFGGTISSTLQYHNALAALLGAVFFIGLHLWHRSSENSRIGQAVELKLPRLDPAGYLYACGNFLLLAVLIGSKSRAGLLVFGLVFVIYLIGAGNQRRLTASLASGFLGAVAYAVIGKFLILAQNKQPDQAWLWIVGGLFIALAGQFAYTLLSRHVLDRWAAGDGRKFILTFAAMAAIVIVAGGIWASGKAHVFERATSLEYLWTAYQRFYYIESSIDMIQERPLLGWGGGGWKEAYEAYLSFRYTTREAHSYPFQVGVETGIAGIVIVAGMWLSFLLLVIRRHRDSDNNPQRRQVLWLCTVVFLMLAGHSLIDFDLSLSALALVLWGILGVATALAYPVRGVEKKKEHNPHYAPLGVVTAAGLLIITGAAFLAQAAGFASQASANFRNNQPDAGIAYLEKAKTYNPFKSDYRISLSQVYINQGEKEKALEEANSAVNLSKYGFAPRINYVQIAAAAGNNGLAAAELEKIPALAPNNILTYEQYGINYLNIGINELTSGNKNTAKAYLNKAAAATELITKQESSLSDMDKEMWSGPLLEINDKIRLITGQAHYCLGDVNESMESLRQAVQSTGNNVKAQALLWLALIEEKNGNMSEHNNLIDQVNSINPELVKNYPALKNIPVLQ